MLPPGNRRQVFHWEKYRRSAGDSCIANEPPKNAHWNTPQVGSSVMCNIGHQVGSWVLCKEGCHQVGSWVMCNKGHQVGSCVMCNKGHQGGKLGHV